MGVQLGSTGQQDGVPEHDHSVFGPNVEVADPELFIDERNKRGKFHAARFRDLEVKGTGNMQGVHFRKPGEGDDIIGPTSGDRNRNFISFFAVEGSHSMAFDVHCGREMHPHFRRLIWRLIRDSKRGITSSGSTESQAIGQLQLASGGLSPLIGYTQLQCPPSWAGYFHCVEARLFLSGLLRQREIRDPENGA